MTETVLNVLKILGLFIALVGGSFVIYYAIVLIKRLADKYGAEKISARIYDAIEKMKMVVSVLSSNLFTKMSEETIKALADGVVTNEEVGHLLDELADEAMKTLGTELPTLSKYFLGENVKGFIKNLAKKYLVDYAKAKLGVGMLSLQK
jgi:hypothetical protein